MTKKEFYLGYMVFVLAMIIAYFTIPHKYGIYALIGLAILFGVYQFFLLLKKKTRQRLNKNLS